MRVVSLVVQLQTGQLQPGRLPWPSRQALAIGTCAVDFAQHSTVYRLVVDAEDNVKHDHVLCSQLMSRKAGLQSRMHISKRRSVLVRVWRAETAHGADGP